MAYLIAPTEELGYPGFQLGTPGIPHSIFTLTEKVTLPSGTLRIGGDAPSGLVLHGVAPVSRTIDLFDTDTNAHVARTTSSPLDGTYEFPNLSDRSYFVICRGLPGERDQIYNNVSPV